MLREPQHERARKRDSRASDVPTLEEVFDQYKVAPANRSFAQVVLAAGDFGRPMMVTPGTPPERVKILREAVLKTLKDPEVAAEAKKARMAIDPTSGEELEKLVKEIFDSPPEVLERVKRILGS